MTTPIPARVSLRRLPAACGWSFLAAGFAARLPQAMVPMGMLLLIAATTGRYGIGGLAIACWSIGCAVGGPMLGMLADRYGHRVIGLIAAAGNIASMGAFVGVAHTTPSPYGLLPVAVVVGLTNPQIGALARSRWARLARRRADGPALVATAMAYEGAADETSFVLGPTLAGLLTAAVSPSAPLFAATALAVVGQVMFALHGTAAPAASAGRRAQPRTPLPWRAIAPLGLALAAVGMVFGSTQTGLAAVLGGQGASALTGPVYAALGVSSGIAGLLTTMLPVRFSLRARVITCAALLVVLASPLGLVHDPGALAIVLACAGLTLAPLMISGTAMAERVTPTGRSATVMTVLGTAGTVGVALGSAVAGQLADAFGGSVALVIPSVAALLALTGGLLAVPRGQRSSVARIR